MTREEVLTHARTRQRYEAPTPAAGEARPALRIILEFDRRRDPEEVAAVIRAQLGLDVTAMLLFAPPQGGEIDPALHGFVAAAIDGVNLEAIEGQAFELSYAIADATGARTAEPELGADFYSEPPEEGLEGAIEVPGCWAPETDDIAGANPYWALDTINARSAWMIPPPVGGKARGEGVRVFQPDTGVADHVELEAGMLDLASAYDFVDDKPSAIDPLDYGGNPGHGTGTASVVASRVAGKMTGSAPLATLTPLRAVERVVVFDHGRVAAAVEHARRNGAHVITMSLGGAWSSALRAAIDRAIAEGVIVLAAAGNCVSLVVWPARYEEVIAVAGTNISDQTWRGTCKGSAVDISAPGEFVPRAKRNPADGGNPTLVAGGQGTSFAVAICAGVAALWLAHHGLQRVKAAVPLGRSVQELFVALVRATARRPDGFDTSSMGAGIVNAEALLKAGLAEAVEEAPRSPADPFESLRTLVAEAGGTESAVYAIDQRRFAAELSHLALSAVRAKMTGHLESAAAGTIAAPPSQTLRNAVARSGAAGLEVLIGN